MLKKSKKMYRLSLIIFSLLLGLGNFYAQEQSSLFEAVIRNDKVLVDYMIRNRADVTAANRDGMTALHIVSDPNIAYSLILNGANINAANRAGSTPLHWAISYNHIEIIRLLLRYGADTGAQDHLGNTPLHLAVNSSQEIVLMLIVSGANINATNKSGSTPLVEALLRNRTENASYLTLAGAADIKNNQGLTASLLATIDSTPDVKITLEAQDLAPLIREIFIEDYAAATLRIEQGDTLDGIDGFGNTPLHWAIAKKNRPIVRLLLSKGANYTTINDKDLSPLDALIEQNDLNFMIYVQKLLKGKTNFIDTATNTTVTIQRQ